MTFAGLRAHAQGSAFLFLDVDISIADSDFLGKVAGTTKSRCNESSSLVNRFGLRPSLGVWI